MKNHFIVLLMLIIINPSLSALDKITRQNIWGAEFAYYPDSNEAQNSRGCFEWPDYSPEPLPSDFISSGNDKGREIGNGWGAVEFQIYAGHIITIPFLQGNSSLTENNNIKLTFKAYLAPVVAYAEANVVFSPVGFLNFETGYTIGSGWSIPGSNGMGLNNDGSGNPLQKPFAGTVMESWAGGTFQFDLSALIPGKWNHLVTMAKAKFLYANYTEAGKNDPWQWKADSGENFNGLRFKGTYLLGYRMPLRLETVAFMMESSQYIDRVKDLSPMDDGGWGSDFVSFRFGPLVNLKFNDKESLLIILQMKTFKKYNEETAHYNWFVNREYESMNTRFNRLGFSYSHKF